MWAAVVLVSTCATACVFAQHDGDNGDSRPFIVGALTSASPEITSGQDIVVNTAQICPGQFVDVFFICETLDGRRHIELPLAWNSTQGQLCQYLSNYTWYDAGLLRWKIKAQIQCAPDTAVFFPPDADAGGWNAQTIRVNPGAEQKPVIKSAAVTPAVLRSGESFEVDALQTCPGQFVEMTFICETLAGARHIELPLAWLRTDGQDISYRSLYTWIDSGALRWKVKAQIRGNPGTAVYYPADGWSPETLNVVAYQGPLPEIKYASAEPETIASGGAFEVKAQQSAPEQTVDMFFVCETVRGERRITLPVGWQRTSGDDVSYRSLYTWKDAGTLHWKIMAQIRGAPESAVYYPARDWASELLTVLQAGCQCHGKDGNDGKGEKDGGDGESPDPNQTHSDSRF